MSSSPGERLDEFFGPNAGYALELLERVQEQAAPTAEPEEAEAVVGLRASAEISAAAAAAALAQSIRLF